MYAFHEAARPTVTNHVVSAANSTRPLRLGWTRQQKAPSNRRSLAGRAVTRAPITQAGGCGTRRPLQTRGGATPGKYVFHDVPGRPPRFRRPATCHEAALKRHQSLGFTRPGRRQRAKGPRLQIGDSARSKRTSGLPFTRLRPSILIEDAFRRSRSRNKTAFHEVGSSSASVR